MTIPSRIVSEVISAAESALVPLHDWLLLPLLKVQAGEVIVLEVGAIALLTWLGIWRLRRERKP